MKRLLAAIGVMLTLSGIVRGQGTTQDKIYSRQKAFRIPFQIPDPAEQKQLQEVQLYVARNGGKWEKYTAAPPEVPPDKRSFTFRTDQDGEFWFAVRTLDKRGVMNPEDDASMQVGLRVVVDSEVPKIDLRPTPRAGREVGVEWEVQDRNLDLDTLKLEYRVEGQETWQAVPGVLPKFVGQAVWTPDTPGRVTVRCQVQDRAQNLGIQTADLEPGSGAVRAGTNPFPNPTETAPTFKPFNREPEIPVGRQPTAPPPPPPAAVSTRTMPTFPNTPARDVTAHDVPARDIPAPDTLGHVSHEAPPTGRTPAATQSNRAAMQTAATSTVPANRQIVNETEVSLDYEIEDEGPSGVSIIELWVTTDMGRTWQRVGEDADRESPFTVDLGGDGIYGLTLVAKSGVGLGDRPPKSGDQPQTWVEVDQTPPAIQLNTPEVGKGQEMGTVLITWKADDPNIGDRCISLYYNDGIKNEWKPIATGIENSGRYAWRMAGQMPYKFRVAIDVIDLAGNRQMAESGEVTIDMSKPKPKVLGVTPGGNYRR